MLREATKAFFKYIIKSLPRKLKKITAKSGQIKSKMRYPKWQINATQPSFLDPSEIIKWFSYQCRNGNPNTSIKLIQPGRVPVKLRSLAKSFIIPALMAKAKAVVIKAKQLAINNRFLLIINSKDLKFFKFEIECM